MQLNGQLDNDKKSGENVNSNDISGYCLLMNSVVSVLWCSIFSIPTLSSVNSEQLSYLSIQCSLNEGEVKLKFKPRRVGKPAN